MMKVGFKRPRGFGSEGRHFRKEAETRIFQKLSISLKAFQASIMETPVYTGRTITNFRWSLGGPVSGTRSAIKQPDLPGKTSDLDIGGEPRRAANAAPVQAEFQAMLAGLRINPFQPVYLVNNLEHFSDVEYGVYARDGKQSRTPPGGMVRRGETAIDHYMEGVARRVS